MIIQNQMEQIQQNDRLDTILQMFKTYNCDHNTLLDKERLFYILDQQSYFFNRKKFNQVIAEEIFGQAQTLSKAQSTVLIISKIILEAIRILQKRISSLKDQERGIPSKKRQLQSKQRALKMLQQDYQRGYEQNDEKINAARKNINIVNTKIRECQGIEINFKEQYQVLTCCLKVNEMPHLEKTYIIPPTEAPVPQIKQQNLSIQLTMIFGLTLLSLFLELQLLIFSFRPNFLALLSEVLTIYWLFYGYYDQHSVKYLLTGLGCSCLLDIYYLCLFILKEVGTTRYSGQNITTIVLIVLLIMQIISRIFLLIKLFKYRQPITNGQFFQIFGHRVYLNLRSGKQWHD